MFKVRCWSDCRNLLSDLSYIELGCLRNVNRKIYFSHQFSVVLKGETEGFAVVMGQVRATGELGEDLIVKIYLLVVVKDEGEEGADKAAVAL